MQLRMIYRNSITASFSIMWMKTKFIIREYDAKGNDSIVLEELLQALKE